MEKVPLANKVCVACHGSASSLPVAEAQELLTEVGGKWALNDAGHLYKAYKFNDFMGPMAFANKVADLAEQENHHPNLMISWGLCAVEIWTHKVDGLTENDFILASKIEELRA